METAKQLAIPIPMDAIENFCQRWQIAELSVFGSILREDFNADSDIDFLYILKPNIQWRLVDLFSAEEELAKLLGRKIDLVKKSSVEQSHNWLRKQNILSSSQVIYDSE
ncbi:nucleotidyltransferase family protein [Aulosira sp. FACHB-615]|uniref:nucleotidyltransferase family protein n=1 Tax=Aulosira sp. FACHB-615 TaxID=2692777 RepID=UPI001686192F|nr:nucleotidyltransferase domain-containing protein [Aulosira sp. FACHB-615]MBD2486700.1 nucleotidyltransferase domain-containing protein [Aulosira sp. FACHB-615]